MIVAALRWLALTLGLLAGGPAAAQALVPVPALTARVTDKTSTLTAAQIAALEQRLAAFEARKGSQLPEPPSPPTPADDPLVSLPWLIAAVLAVGLVLRALLGRMAGSAATGVVIGVAVWWMQAVLVTALVAGAVALVVSLLASLGRIPMGMGRGAVAATAPAVFVAVAAALAAAGRRADGEARHPIGSLAGPPNAKSPH